MKLERVNIHGATLASLLHSVASSPSPADGVLFGHATRNTREDIHDDFATVNIDTDEAHITSFVCSSSTRSLSNGLGEVQGILPRRPVAGSLDSDARCKSLQIPY